MPVNKTQLFRNPLFSLFLPDPICRSICTAAKSIRACVFRDPSLPREREERFPSRKSVSTRAASTYTSIYEVMKRIRSESRIFSSPLGFAPLNFPRLGCALIRDSSADHSRYPFIFAIYSVLLLFPLFLSLSFHLSLSPSISPSFYLFLSLPFASISLSLSLFRRLPKRNEPTRTSRFRRVSFTVLQVPRLSITIRRRFTIPGRARARVRAVCRDSELCARSNFCNCHFSLSSTRDRT